MNKDKKLNGRDLINIGIYGAIYFVILFAVAMLGMIPVFLPLLSVFVVCAWILELCGVRLSKLKNVTFRYGTAEDQNEAKNSLTGIDLSVKDGEFVLLTGPSGCGKTTILRLINGLIPHFYQGETEGTVLVDGKEIPRNIGIQRQKLQ